MHSYTFTISLRIQNGDFDPSTVTDSLSLEPRWSWRKGDPIINPPDTTSKGIRDCSYWTHRFEENEDEFEDCLVSILSSLSGHRDFFHCLRDSGSIPELFIGIFGSQNLGFTISHFHSVSVNDLKLDLVFDIYPQPRILAEQGAAANP